MSMAAIPRPERGLAALLLLAVAMAAFAVAGTDRAPFVTTPEAAVTRLLELAETGADDRVYDLGSGDGRIVIAAARDFGASGVGVEIDPHLVRLARRKAEQAGVAGRVRFMEGDLFAVDLREATVVTLFLRDSVNRRLRPRLWQQLAPGTPVVSYRYDMGPEWTPERVEVLEGEPLYLYRVPEGQGHR
jgi:SAM-dependent methyltransferase